MRQIAVAVQNQNKNVTPIQTIDAIKNAGFENIFVQWLDKDWECSQEEQVDYVKKLGLNIIFAHLGCQNINSLWEKGEIGDGLVKRYKEDIRQCKKHGISMVIMHLTTKYEAPMYNEVGLNRIKQIVDFAKTLDVKVAFENTKIKGYLEYVLQNIDNDNVGICFDVGHCHTHFNDEFNFEIFKNRIFAVHLHDNDKSDDLHLLPFDGTINWENTVKNLKKSNYNGPVTLELCYRYDYLNMSIDEFYQKGYEVGQKLQEMFERGE